MMDAVAADGVWKYYGDYPALRDVMLHAEPGACLALIGRNGAGKTTLLRIIGGFSKAGRGTIRIFGNDPRETETRRRLGWIGHGISVYDELSALENLRLFGRLYNLPDPGKSAMEWLERTGLERVRDGLVREFSLSTHQLREALELATHVALLNRGKVAFHGERTPQMVEDPGWVYAHYDEA
jgi:ABC-type multidrug transport system ATPase subunit